MRTAVGSTYRNSSCVSEHLQPVDGARYTDPQRPHKHDFLAIALTEHL